VVRIELERFIFETRPQDLRISACRSPRGCYPEEKTEDKTSSSMKELTLFFRSIIQIKYGKLLMYNVLIHSVLLMSCRNKACIDMMISASQNI
jgi:hypothetical protein